MSPPPWGGLDGGGGKIGRRSDGEHQPEAQQPGQIEPLDVWLSFNLAAPQ